MGLDASGSVDLDDLEVATSPLVLVVGSEGEGLGRLVAQTCDLTVSIPMSGKTESLNAGIAANVMPTPRPVIAMLTNASQSSLCSMA